MTSHAAQTVTVTTTDADGTRALGARAAALLRRGDLVMLSGGLGAGKTTLAQGIGSALNVRGRVSSPTFIIARVHPALGEGPDLIHVDAYRLSSLEEIDALDLDSSLQESVTLVEWGEDKVEALSADRLEITVGRPHGGLARPGGVEADGGQETAPSDAAHGVTDLAEVDDGRRTITLTAVGPRWAGVDLDSLLA
ncbi:MAG: tRNA (adenosine(37)-N6)-threonylcarbamoyltransferase complex ATPase subunit type 1 TsaE [Actinomyces urogenitalis]|uniref:tRNA (adenosine(37)-N6)-threonylcarbamoyltransferase complex ATPase subunit type 1 TsaE n=1 Tax=Actinomyces urogenitalis TaxID=103621 RepID=UPI002A83EAB6|nr:tRNA (adenosine(37)-N6)-threonylcarbamoyltransferase complex ATPase subunit type 1 TsaE [Actinomyces urogenitalis]MDY3678833.1 tRNA (adenosine(37)-N6)-threonylcarbamoyltransferase complex ATPase subunit type 1 TsaE [Actinomyces urogenitalis]